MPIYEFKCERCGRIEEKFLHHIENEEKEGRLVILCPVCNAQMEKKMSVFNFANYPVKAVRLNEEEIR